MYQLLSVVFLMATLWLPSVSAAVIGIGPSPSVPSKTLSRPENDTEFWLHEAQQFVQQRTARTLNTAQARNTVLVIGSGMSMTTLAATRVYIGAEETQLAFESFAGVGQLRTYCVDQQVPDEACAATALFAGTKANGGTVGVTAAVAPGECRMPAPEHRVASLARDAIAAGKWVGIVTNGRVTAPTVAGLYAAATNATWENDVLVRQAGCDPIAVQDIAKQLVHGEVGANLRVVLGGGRREFRDRTMTDEQSVGAAGVRGDGRDLIREWSSGRYERNASYVWNKAQFDAVHPDETEYLLGLFGHGAMLGHLQATEERVAQPTLEEMTTKAVQLLGRNRAGYLLVVVNALIDEAHHHNWARVALDESAELDRVVASVKRLTVETETLTVVTADHSHTLTYSGYPIRHNDIFGIADNGTWVGDGMPIMTLSYAAGAGHRNHMKADGRRERIDPTSLDTTGRKFAFPATMPAGEEMHGGDDVAVYANGPWAHLFDGSAEQSLVAHVVRFAMCLGDDEVELNACNVGGIPMAWNGTKIREFY